MLKVLHIPMKLNKSFIALLLDTKALFPEKPYPTNPWTIWISLWQDIGFLSKCVCPKYTTLKVPSPTLFNFS